MKQKSVKDFLMNNALYVIIALLLIAIIAMDPTFLNVRNFTTILSQSSTRIILACGIGGIIVLGTTLIPLLSTLF